MRVRVGEKRVEKLIRRKETKNPENVKRDMLWISHLLLCDSMLLILPQIWISSSTMKLLAAAYLELFNLRHLFARNFARYKYFGRIYA